MLPNLTVNMTLWLLGAFAFLLHTYRRMIKSISITKIGKNNDIWKIPGPISLPYIGTNWIYIWRYKPTKIHEVYEDLRRRHGDVVREVIQKGHIVISLYKKEDIEKVLRYPSRYPFRPASDIIKNYRLERPEKFASAGIVNEQGEMWWNIRSKTTSELNSAKTVLRFLPELNIIGDDFVNLLKMNRDQDSVVELFQHFASRYGLETTCALVLGQRMTFMNNELSINAQALEHAVNNRFKAERDSVYASDLESFMKTKSYHDFIVNEEQLYSIMSEIVEDARISTDVMHDDLKCILMSIVEKPDLDEKEKKSTLIDLVAAGISTFSNSLTFMFYLLAKNPKCQQKIFEELEEICPNSNHITALDISRMTYTKACMQETFRIIPVAFGIGRVTEVDLTFSGYTVPAGTQVLCHTKIACQDNENFYRAKEFLPERWIENKETQATTSSIFAPFGIGRRQCPGKRFMEQATVVTTAKIIREFIIEFDGELDIQFEFILSPKTPVRLKLRDRC